MVMTHVWKGIRVSETTKQRLNHIRVPPETTDDTINRMIDERENKERIIGPKIYLRIMRLKNDSDTVGVFMSRVLDHYDGSIWLKPNSKRQALNRAYKRIREEMKDEGRSKE
jgi:hypothetical protein